MKKLVYVTGAGRGIGRAIALHLVKQGYAVAGCSRTMAELQETQRLSEGEISIAVVDVTDERAVGEWMKREASRGEPWGLISAAGIYGPIGSFIETEWKDWTNAIEINLYGTVIPVRCFTRELLKSKKPGRVVLLSGGGATQPLPNFTSYCASKSAVVRFGETIALELKPFSITVNSIAPGAVNTLLTDQLIEAGPEKAGADMYARALKQKESGGANPAKAAELTEYLLSPQAEAITGRLISAIWDPWSSMHSNPRLSEANDIYTLRRIVPPEESAR